MSGFSNWRISFKILTIILVLALVAVVLSWISVASLRAMGQAGNAVATAAQRNFNAGRATANLLAYARNVEYLPLKLTPADRTRFEAEADDEIRRFRARLDWLARNAASDDDRREVDAARTAIARYEQSVHAEVRRLAAAGNLEQATDAAFRGAAGIEETREAIRRIEDRNGRMMDAATKAAAELEADSLTSTIAISAGGILVGIVLGLFLSARYITGPLNGITASMGLVAKGDFAAAVPGAGRGDEIGAMAGAVEVFKRNGAEAVRLATEAEHNRLKEIERQQRDAERERLAAEERRASTRRPPAGPRKRASANWPKPSSVPPTSAAPRPSACAPRPKRNARPRWPNWPRTSRSRWAAWSTSSPRPRPRCRRRRAP